MSKKKPHILVNLFLRMLLALFSLPLLAFIATTNVSAATVGSETPQQYLALGDSLAFGFQPNGDFSHGYATDLFQTLQAKQDFGNLTNGGCPGETSSTFINGGICYSPPASQLAVALAFLQQNANTTGLVTLQIGANDILGAINPHTCTLQPDLFNTNLAVLDQNLTQVILPLLHGALAGNQHAHLVLVEYYNPFQPSCPNTTPFMQTFNQHLTEDAEGFAQTVSIFNSFDRTNALVCKLTWICDQTTPDIHPRTRGYDVIADLIYKDIFGHDND